MLRSVASMPSFRFEGTGGRTWDTACLVALGDILLDANGGQG